MKISYNVLWFEDDEEWYDSMKPSIQRFLLKNGFNLVDKRIVGYEDGVFDENYDLILMDFKIAGENGAQVIDKIRDYEIYTEVVFYSQEGTGVLRDQVSNYELDGVYCTGRDKDEFLEKAEKVIMTTIKKVLDLNSLRGLVMAEVGDMEKKFNEVISLYVMKKGADSKKDLIEYIKEKSITFFKSKIRKFNELNHEKFDEFLTSSDFGAHSKLISLLHIVKELKSIGIDVDECRSCLNDYDEEILKPRNLLAHIMEEKHDDGTIFLASPSGSFIFNDDECIILRNNILKHSENIDILHSILGECTFSK